MKFPPRVCDSSLFSRLPGTQFPVSMIHSDNVPVLKRTFACPRFINDFRSFLSSLYVRTTNIY